MRRVAHISEHSSLATKGVQFGKRAEAYLGNDKGSADAVVKGLGWRSVCMLSGVGNWPWP